MDALSARGGVDHMLLLLNDGLSWQLRPCAELNVVLDGAFAQAAAESDSQSHGTYCGQTQYGVGVKESGQKKSAKHNYSLCLVIFVSCKRFRGLSFLLLSFG